MPWTIDNITGDVTLSGEGDDGIGPAPYGMPNIDPSANVLNQGSVSPVPDDISQAVAGMGNPVLPQSQSQSQSASVSRSGTDFSNGGAFDMAQTKGMKGFAKDKATAHNEAQTYGKQLWDGREANIDAQAAANRNVGELEAQRADVNAQATMDYANKEKQNAIDNAADYEKIQHKVSGYMANYESAVNDLAATGINPGRAYSNMTNAQKGGTLVTAFVTDFLGAKGIKTHGMDYINKMIDNDIQAQRDDLQTKKDTVQGKMNLYKLFKEQGDSDYLAAEKTRGAMLNAFATEVKGKLAAFDSPLARARIQQADALFGQSKLDQFAKVSKEVQDLETQRVQQAVTLRGQSLDAGRAAASLAESKRQFNATREDSKNAKSPWDPRLLVRDTSGKVAIQAPNEATRNKLQDQVIAQEQFVKGVGQLIGALQEAGPTYKGLGNKYFAGYAEKNYNSKYEAMISDLIFAQSGKAATNEEVARFKEQLPFASLTSGILSGEGAESITKRVLAARGIDRVENLIEAVTAQGIPVPPEIAAQYQGGITPGAFKNTKARGTELGITERGDNKPADKTTVEEAIGKLSQENGEDVKSRVSFSDDTDGSLQEYFNSLHGSEDSPIANSPWGSKNTDTAPRWMGALDTIYDSAQTSTGEVQKQAQDALWDATKNADPEIAAGALYYIEKLSSGKLGAEADPWKQSKD